MLGTSKPRIWIAFVWAQAALTACSGRPAPVLDDAVLPPATCQWQRMNSGTTDILRAIWGSGPGDIFVAGSKGSVLRFDGSAWEPLATSPAKPLAALWGSGPNNVFGVAYSSGENLFRYEGVAWTTAHSATEGLRGIWGSSPDDIYAVGSSGRIVHFGHGQWQEVFVPESTDLLTGVWGSGSNNVFVVGYYGVVLHHDNSGSAWKMMDPGVKDSFHGVTGLAPNDVYVLAEGAKHRWYLLHYDGTGWRPIDLPSQHRQSAVLTMGKQGSEILLGLMDGLLLRYDGQGWREDRTGVAVRLYGIWSPGPHEIFVTGEKGTILHRSCPP